MKIVSIRLLIEFVYCALWSFFSLTAAIDSATRAGRSSSLGAAAFFAFAATAVYAADAFFKFRGWRAGQLAQGQRTVQKATNVSSANGGGGDVPAPAY